MKVLQINSVCGIGSTGRIATDIHDILHEQGHESNIAYGRGEAFNCDRTIRIGTSIDNFAHVALTRLLDQHGFGSKKATIAFIKQLEFINPDIIHLHNIHGYYLNIEVLFNYLRSVDKPIIWTLHDCWAFTGHCSHFDFIGCNKWKTGCYECPDIKSYPASILIDNSKTNYIKKKELFSNIKNLTIVVPTNWLASLVKESFLNQYPIVVINNGIDLNRFKPIKSNFRKKLDLDDKFILLGVANIWSSHKGLDYFIELSKDIQENQAIVLVGLNADQIKGLPKNIIGILKTKHIRELAEIYSAADVFINPTLEEVMGLTNVEALACGTPVITFETGGSPETIDESCGIVARRDINELKESIKIIQRNGKLAYKSKCIQRAKKYFDKNERYKDYLNLYNKQLSLSLRFFQK